MEIEKQVVSLELSKQLKEAGYPQKGVWWWVCHHGVNDNFKLTMLENSKKDNELWEVIVAPTVAELGERLPRQIERNGELFQLFTEKTLNGWGVMYAYEFPGHKNGQGGLICWRIERADTEANARAKMWLYLKKEAKCNKKPTK